MDIISGGSGWTPGQSGSGGTSFLYCHQTSLGEFNPHKGQGVNLLILTAIFPFPKQVLKVLICNTPFNLLLGTEKKMTYCPLVPQPWWLFASHGFTSSCQAQWIWTHWQHSSRQGGTGIWLLLSSLIQSQSLRVSITKTHNPTKNASN